jgi:hypothetical protein
LPLQLSSGFFIFTELYSMKLLISVLAIMITIVSCNHHPAQNVITEAGQKDTIAAQKFFPIADFIGGQIKMIDSLQLPLSKSVTSGKNTKPASISDREFKSLAVNFLHPDINDTAIKKFYTETSVADQSIPSVTLMYATTNTALLVQKINVFIKPDPVKNDKVSAIYIEKIFTNADTSISQKLYWKTGKNFQIITEKRIGNISLPVEQVKVIWDPVE